MEQFNEFTQHLEEPEWIKEYRLNSFLRIKDSKEVSFKHGLNIKIKPNFELSALVPKAKVDNNLSIVYDKDLVQVYSGNQIKKQDIDIDDAARIKMFMSDDWVDEEDQMYHFTQAFTNDFLLIKIPRDCELPEPIQIEHELKDSPTITSIFILAEENSKAQILLNKKGNAALVTENVRIITKASSKIEFISLQNLSKDTINFQTRKAIMGKDSDVQWMDICLGSDYTKSSVISSLKTKGASTKNTVLYLATGKQKFDVFTGSIHIAPNTYSNIVTKGVLNHEAKALSRGLVRIEEDAAGSNGYETQDALLLSSDAEADAIPNLEIHNHDVKCSHGSTVGQVDKEKLFYLMSRGLTEDLATQKIVEGYFTPVLDLFKNDDVKNQVHESIIRSLR